MPAATLLRKVVHVSMSMHACARARHNGSGGEPNGVQKEVSLNGFQ